MRLGSLINCSGEGTWIKGQSGGTQAQQKKTVRDNQEDFVFTGPPGVKLVVLSPDNVW